MKTYYLYRHITAVFTFLNSLCNSDSKPLVNTIVPFLQCIYTYWGERSEPRIGEVNANSVCLYVCVRVSSTDRPVGRIAHAQKHAKHML